MNGIYKAVELLHPVMRDRVIVLREALETAYSRDLTPTLFRVFETYRTPMRQTTLLQARATKAAAWQSAHQFGLAADFVAWNPKLRRWSWEPEEDWDFLKATAEDVGLSVPIEWDRVHVEHPAFRRYRDVFRG